MKLKQKLNGSAKMETEPRVVTDDLLNINELDLAQRRLLKLVQNQAFCKEIEVLKKKGNILRTSRIYGLDPYVDSNGLLKMGGRLREGELDANIAHLYCHQGIAAYQLQSSDGAIKMWPMEEQV